MVNTSDELWRARARQHDQEQQKTIEPLEKEVRQLVTANQEPQQLKAEGIRDPENTGSTRR